MTLEVRDTMAEEEIGEWEKKLVEGRLFLRAAPEQHVSCAHCGKDFTLPVYVYNKRIQYSVSGRLFCSVTCRGKASRRVVRG